MYAKDGKNEKMNIFQQYMSVFCLSTILKMFFGFIFYQKVFVKEGSTVSVTGTARNTLYFRAAISVSGHLTLRKRHFSTGTRPFFVKFSETLEYINKSCKASFSICFKKSIDATNSIIRSDLRARRGKNGQVWVQKM